MKNTYINLKQNLDKLKLTQINIHLDEVIDEITLKNKSFIEGLEKLIEYELEYKEKSATKAIIRTAAFPFHKTINDFDFEFQPTINKQQILDFTTLRFINNNENIVFLGPSGVGKTHLATAIGIAAANQGVRPYFIKFNKLITKLKKAQTENRLDSAIKTINRHKLLIIDEIGYLPIGKDEADIFFQLIDLRYEKRSMIITTNANFDLWEDIFKDSLVSSAIIDRLLHHSTVVKITGKSYRLKQYYKKD